MLRNSFCLLALFLVIFSDSLLTGANAESAKDGMLARRGMASTVIHLTRRAPNPFAWAEPTNLGRFPELVGPNPMHRYGVYLLVIFCAAFFNQASAKFYIEALTKDEESRKETILYECENQDGLHSFSGTSDINCRSILDIFNKASIYDKTSFYVVHQPRMRNNDLKIYWDSFLVDPLPSAIMIGVPIHEIDYPILEPFTRGVDDIAEAVNGLGPNVILPVNADLVTYFLSINDFDTLNRYTNVDAFPAYVEVLKRITSLYERDVSKAFAAMVRRRISERRVEYIQIKDRRVAHLVENIKADGSCLFRAIAFGLLGNQNRGGKIRADVVDHVTQNWENYSVLSCNEIGDNYPNADEYREEMSQVRTFGSLCEIYAAAAVYERCIEVYRNGQLYTAVGEPLRGTIRLKFSGDLSSGHFDALLPLPKNIEKLTKLSTARYEALRNVRNEVKETLKKAISMMVPKMIDPCLALPPEAHKGSYAENRFTFIACSAYCRVLSIACRVMPQLQRIHPPYRDFGKGYCDDDDICKCVPKGWTLYEPTGFGTKSHIVTMITVNNDVRRLLNIK